MRRVTGKDIREFMRESVQDPLGFHSFNYGVPEKDTNRVAINYYTGIPLMFPLTTIIRRAIGASWEDAVRISNDLRFLQVIIPSANLFSTADEVSRFFNYCLIRANLTVCASSTH